MRRCMLFICSTSSAVRSCSTLPRNVNKEHGIVNGAFGHELHFSRVLVVLRLDSGSKPPSAKWRTRDQMARFFVAYILELGYACTLAKVQGYTSDIGVAKDPDIGVPGGAMSE